MGQVLPASRVPSSHVLLHAVGVASLLAGGEGRAGRGHAALEAVFVEFLRMFVRRWFSGVGVLLRLSYFDQSAGVADGGLLAHLLHHFGLCVGGHFGGAISMRWSVR